MKNELIFLVILLSFFSLDQVEDDFYSSGIKKSDLQDHYGAIADYSRAIELDPHHDLAYYNRAVEKTKIGSLREAITDFTRAIEINPSSEAYYNRGRNRAAVEDHEGAIKDFTKTIELNPVHIGSYFDRGLSKLVLGETESGRQDLKQARMMGKQQMFGVNFDDN